MWRKEVIEYHVFDISKERILFSNSYFKKEQKKAKQNYLPLYPTYVFIARFKHKKTRNTCKKPLP